MNSRLQSYVAAGLSVAVGAWILLIPAITSVTGGALVMVLSVGGIIALTGLVELFWKNEMPSWLGALAALWLLVSALAFDVSTTASWYMALAAIAAFALAVWDGMEAYQMERTSHQHA